MSLCLRTRSGVKTFDSEYSTTTPRKLRGLCLCWRVDKKTYEYAKLVHRGSAYGGTGLFVRFNGIDYEVAKQTVGTSCIIYDDCGQELVTSANITDPVSITDGLKVGSSYNVITYSNTDLRINPMQTWTVHFKVKNEGRSSNSTNKPYHILSLYDGDAHQAGLKISTGDVLHFGLSQAGALMFTDHFHTDSIAGTRTAWRDYKITFNPTGRTEYNKTAKSDVYIVNYTITHNGSVKTGTTYLVDNSTYWQFSLSCSVGWSKSITSASFAFGGWFRFLSISQDAEGYSPYRRSTHKLLLHFD